MSGDKVEVIANHEPVAEGSQAPPYIQHRDPLELLGDRIEYLPLYREQDDPNCPLTIHEVDDILRVHTRARENDLNIWKRYLDGCEARKKRADESVYIIPHYFLAIENGQEDVVTFLIENDFVTANTLMFNLTPYTTPLLKAISTSNVRMVQLLLELGANPNEFGCVVCHPFFPSLLKLTLFSLGVGIHMDLHYELPYKPLLPRVISFS